MYGTNICYIRGFYPKGGGKVVIAVKPITHIRPIRLMERGKLQEVTLEGYATEGIPPHVSECLFTERKYFVINVCDLIFICTLLALLIRYK